MANTITDAVAAIQAVVAALPGILEAPANPLESIGELPYGHSFPKKIKVDASGPAGSGKWIVTIGTDILCGRQDLPADVALATPYGDSFPNAIWHDPTLAGTVDTVNEVRATFGEVTYAKVVFIGWSFEIDFKIEKPLTS